MTTKPQYVYVTYIATTPERVWAALTEGEFTRDYWGGLSITSDWQVGSRVEHRRADGGVGWEARSCATSRRVASPTASIC